VFLANDAVFPQGLAFLESFRTHNPASSLSMIPFADDISRFESVSKIYDFDILRLDTKPWDELAREFFPRVEQKYRNRLRKLAVFDVKSPTTLYSDLDIVVLKDLSFLDAKIIDGSVDIICAATHNDPFVYNSNYKVHEQFKNAKRFADGFFAFNPHSINADAALRVLAENKDLYLKIRAPEVYCQPVTNFIVDMLNLKIGEVYRLFPNLSPRTWYGSGIIEQDSRAIADDGREVLFVHWAGPVNFNRAFRMQALFYHYHSAALMRLAAHGVASLAAS
jgi:hypothetical protein